MWRGYRSQTYLAVGLGTVDRGHAAVGEQPAPVVVGADHQFRHQLVQRRAALALDDTDALIFDVEVIVDAVLVRRGPAAHRLQFKREPPQKKQLNLEREFASLFSGEKG